MLKAKEYKDLKHEIIEAYYDLYHKDNLCYPEARDKDSYCDMMMKQVGINEIEHMKKMSMRTTIETENDEIERKALRLYRLICKMKERFFYNFDSNTDRIA